MIRRSLALIFLLCAVNANAAPIDDVWMSVLLDGRKIGNMHTTRKIEGSRVVSAQSMQIEIERSGFKIAMSTSETDEETRDGKPLKFESRTKISGIQSVQTGEVKPDGTLEVISEVGGAKQTRTVAWPNGALLAEGLRLKEERSGLAPGTRYKSLTFQPENLEAVEVDSIIGNIESIDLPEGKRDLTRIEQLIQLGGAPTKTIAWVAPDHSPRKLLVSMMGYDLTMIACSRRCANAPNQAADILVHSLLAAPKAISAQDRSTGIRLTLTATDSSGDPLQFASTDEQSVRTIAGRTELRIVPIDASAAASNEPKPAPSDTQPNDWLQSTAPEIVRLAHQGVGNATTSRAKMQNLEDFVRGFIRTKDLSVGYASALEVAKNPEGDCTEHAVLLAALGRAEGIPTRVVDGLVYVDRYAGSDHVFVPHAWMQAYVDGHWRSFDAALRGFDAGHIALSTGDGDPWRFYAGFNTLGRLRLESVEAAQ